jgi:hypothetical protein
MIFTPSIIINLSDIYDGKLTSSLREEVSLNTADSPHVAHVDAITNNGNGYWYDHQFVDLGNNEQKSNIKEGLDFVSTLTNKVADIRALVNADTDVNINVYVIKPLYQTEPEDIYNFLINALEEVCKTNLVQQFNVFTVGLTSGFSQVVTHEIDTLKAIARRNLEKLNGMPSLSFPHKLILLDTIGVTGASVGFYCYSLSKTIAELVRLHSTGEYIVAGAFSNSYINSIGIGIIECEKHLLNSYLSCKITEDFIAKNSYQLNKRNRNKLHQLSNEYLESQMQLLADNKSIDTELDKLKGILGKETQSIKEKAYIFETILSKEESEELRLLDYYDIVINQIKHLLPEDTYSTFAQLRSLKSDLIDAENDYNDAINSNDAELITKLKEDLNTAKLDYQTSSKLFYKLIKTLDNPHTRKKIFNNSKELLDTTSPTQRNKSKGCWLLNIFKINRNTETSQKYSTEFNKEKLSSSAESIGIQIEHLKAFKGNAQYHCDQLNQLNSKLELWKESTESSRFNLNFARPLFIKLLFTKETLDNYFKEQYTKLSINNLNIYDTLISAISNEEDYSGETPAEQTLKEIKDTVKEKINKNLSFINDFNIYHYFENNYQYKYLIQDLDLDHELTTVYNAANPFVHCTEVYKNYDRFGNPASVQSKFSNMLFSPNYSNDEDVNDFKSILKKIISNNSPNQTTYFQERYKISFLRIPYDLEMEHLVEWYASPEDMPTTYEEYEELHQKTVAKQNSEYTLDLEDQNEEPFEIEDEVTIAENKEINTVEIISEDFSSDYSESHLPLNTTP